MKPWKKRDLSRIPPPFWHDGPERPIQRPTDPVEQRDYYSGKSHEHTLKNVVVATDAMHICFLSPTVAGRIHDTRVADEAGYTSPEGSILGQDTGFQGFSLKGVIILQPKKKPRGRALTDAEKAENQVISRIRIKVEHTIGGVKRYHIVGERIRIHCEYFRDRVMAICCGLHHLRRMISIHAQPAA